LICALRQRTFLIGTHTLAMHVKLTEADEKLLIPSVILAILYERQQLKDLYTS